MYSAMSVAGVIGYPAKTRQPAAMAPSVSAYVPASSRRRPALARRAQSDHGATRVPSSVASRIDITGLLASRALSRLTSEGSSRDDAFRQRRLGLQRHVDAEVWTDLVAEHAADAVDLLRGVHREPPEPVGRLAPREHVDRTNRETESTRLAHVFGDDHIPLASG